MIMLGVETLLQYSLYATMREKRFILNAPIFSMFLEKSEAGKIKSMSTKSE